MKLVYQYIAIFFNFQTTSNHLHPLQVENCDSNSRLEVDEDDYSKFRPERVKHQIKHVNYWSQIKQNMSNFQPLEIAGRGSETQLQVDQN